MNRPGIQLPSLAVGLLTAIFASAEPVSLSGTIEANFCPQTCGICCPTHIITDTSGSLTLPVGNSFVKLDNVSGDATIHHFTGTFYETSGQCEVGECTLFQLESMDQQPAAEPVYDPDSGELKIESAVIVGTDTHYSLTLTPPFQINSLVELTKENLAAQTESCEDPQTRCDEGLVCLDYYGIAGANGPLFQTCEIPCSHPDATCPVGQSCVTIADGPGPVCRTD